MISAKALSNLLYTLYSAPPRPAAWNDFLRDLCTQANLSGAAILEHDVEREHHNVQYSYGSDSEWAGLYKEYYGQIDEYKERFLRTQEGVFALGDELCPPSKMKVTEFYNDFLQKYDIRLYGAIATVNRPNHLEHISLYSSWKNKRRGAHARELGALLFPHLKNALDLRRKFVDIAAVNSSLMAGLDLLPQGIILIGQAGIIAVNRAAEQILRVHDGLLIVGNHLAADIPSESHRLQNLIAKVNQTAWLDLSSLSEVTLVSRRSAAPLQVLVVPVVDFPADAGRPGRAIVLINDPQKQVRAPANVFRTLFGLTPAESRVAMLLADGYAPGEIAETVGVSRNTLKSQLASIYRKTETRRQSQLVRLLLRMAILTAGRS